MACSVRRSSFLRFLEFPALPDVTSAPMGRFVCALGFLDGGDTQTPWPGKRPGHRARKTHRAQTPRPSRAGQAGGRRGGRQAGGRAG
eukprot:6244205-Alexandrium_andersonii.AAC.1